MRPQSLLIGLMVLGLSLAAPCAWADDPDDSEGSDDESTAAEEDGESQVVPPKVRLDNARSPMIERKLDPKMSAVQRAKESGGSSDRAGKDDGDEDEGDTADKGLAGGEGTVVGGGDGHWSTAASAERKAVTPPPRDTLVNIDFVDTELKDVIKYFAEITGRNFILAEKLSGKITIISPTPVTVAEAYEAFISALDAAGFTTVTEGKVTRIISNRDSMKEPIRMYKDDYLPYTANMVTRILRLENVSADDVAKIASKMVGDGGDVTSYAPTNSLIITDSANNIRRIEDLLTELDVSAPTQKLEVIQIEYAEAGDIVEKIKEIFGVDSQTATAQTQTSSRDDRRNRRSSRRKGRDEPSVPKKSATSEQVGQESYIGKVLADERTNSVIIMATEQALEDVKEFIARLDINIEISDGDIHVVYLEHADAVDLAQVLSNLTQETNSQSKNARSPRTSRGSQRQPPGGDRPGPAGGPAGASIAEFEGGVKVTADEATNSLVITASRNDFYRLKRVIDMLDIRRKQVFVEAVIMEVSDNNERDTGVSFHSGYTKDSLGESGIGLGGIGSVGGGTLSSALTGDSSGLAIDLSGIALGVFGSALPVTLPGVGEVDIPAFGVILTALESESNTEVLSAPNLMTLDNEEAEIIVGQTIPFSSGYTMTTQGMPVSNFSREDVALTLRITPRINESDFVTLEVFQEITEVVPETQGSDILTSGGVTTTKRSVETVVAVRSNQTIVLGGLMQTTETLSEDKVPILGDIPVIGALFRSKKKTDKKTNLLLFLTPHVIDTPEDLQEVYTIKMLQRQEFLRRFYGKSLEEKQAELNNLLMYSMNLPGLPPAYVDREPVIHPDSIDLYESDVEPTPPPEGPMDVSKPIDWPDTDDGGEDDSGGGEDDDEQEDDGGAPELEDGGAGGGGADISGDDDRRPYPLPGELLITPGGGELRWEADLEEGS